MSREISQWEGSKLGLKGMIGVLKNHLDPGVLAGTGGGAWEICGPCTERREL